MISGVYGTSTHNTIKWASSKRSPLCELGGVVSQGACVRETLSRSGVVWLMKRQDDASSVQHETTGGGFGPGTFISFALLSKAGRNAVSLWKDFFLKEIARNWRSDFGDFFFRQTAGRKSQELVFPCISNLWVSKSKMLVVWSVCFGLWFHYGLCVLKNNQELAAILS